MKVIKITGRNSVLSLLQMEVVRKKITADFPGVKTEIIARSSRGDELQDIPLQTVEGSDFFTQDIFDALTNGEADIAVHSLKDMSSEHFFGPNKFAVVDRDDVRDVAIFNPEVIEKLKEGKEIIIGTCSPRREEMAVDFLQKALPQTGNFSVTTKVIRGNVDTRLRKLTAGEYDGIILAAAGLNRLLKNESTSPPVTNPEGGLNSKTISELLQNKLLMLLPLIECVPAPCQGAIVAEAHYSNLAAIEVLQKINDKVLLKDCIAEKQTAMQYGAGCLQNFGVTSIRTKKYHTIYAAGKDSAGNLFSNWSYLPGIHTAEETIFSSTDYMKDFFKYEWKNEFVSIEEPVVFVANYKALQQSSIKNIQLNGVPSNAGTMPLSSTAKAGKTKTMLASGTRTWLELAKQGYWVTASADGLGFEFLLPALQMPLLQIVANDICIITHEDAAARWKQKGYHAVSNYSLQPNYDEAIAHAIAKASFIFWTSFSQYQYYQQFCKADVTHACAGGETALQLEQQGVKPVIFPTIKSFEQWRKTSIRSHSAA